MTQQLAIPATTVLFMDANKDERTCWIEQLQSCSADYEILEASDMQSGLDLYRSRRIDCVVLELSLPDYEGFKTLVELVPLTSRPTIAVIVLTKMAIRGLWELAKRNGAYACFRKQLTTGAELHQAIQSAIAFVGQLPKEERRHWHPSL